MSSLPVAVLLLGIYALCMLALSQWVERNGPVKRRISASPTMYGLSLAAYLTTWTYYGSVGQAANSGLIFLAAYLGPLVFILVWPWLLGRILRLKGTIRVTSIADYLGARYGRSHLVAGVASSMALLGSLPYVALQMKAVTSTLALLIAPQGSSLTSSGTAFVWVEAGMLVFMMAFTIMAGMRRIDPTERHQGVIAVVVFECLVKLAGFLAVGIYVTYGMFDGFGDIFEKAAQASLGHLTTIDSSSEGIQDWMGRLALFMPAILLLPRQFHVAVVENSNPRHVRQAVWILPLYMLLITLFVVPVALGGRLMGLPAQAGDSFALILPQLGGNHWLSFMVFLGGFSAAMSMIVLNAMTTTTMVANDLILPLTEGIPGGEFIRRKLLPLRWTVLVCYLSAGYLVNKLIGAGAMLESMGVISMAAAAQFTPAAIGGLFWRGANKAGAVSGLLAGFFIWLYSLVLPVLAKNGVIPMGIMEGPFGLACLAPESLFGLRALSPLNHALFWSILFNTGAYALVSLLVKPSRDERELAFQFFSAAGGTPVSKLTTDAPRHIELAPRRKSLEDVFGLYMGPQSAVRYVGLCIARAGCGRLERVSVLELAAIYAEAEMILSGLVGAASAHKAITNENLYTSHDREELSTLYGRVLADLNVSPEELRRRVDYYKEREALLMENASALTSANKALEEEVRVRRQFEEEARQAEEKYRSIFDNAVEGIFQSSLSGLILNANPSAARILGYKNLHDLKSSVGDVGRDIYVTPGDRERFLAKLRQDGTVSNFETIFQRKDGKPVWVSLHARAINDENGNLSLVEGILEDISERKNAERKLEQAAQSVRDIIDSMPSVMVSVDAGGHVLHWNREAASIYGIPPSQPKGGPLADLLPGLAWTRELVDKALGSGEVQSAARVLGESGGKERFYDVLAYPLPGRDEVVLRVDDVTSRVRVEDMMVQTEKMISLGGLAAGMAHEINNPLGAIVGSVQNIERRLEHGRAQNDMAAEKCGTELESVRCYLHERGLLDMIGGIRVSALRAAEIVRNMLEFSRKSEGGSVLADIHSILDKSMELAGQDYDLKKRYDFKQIRIVRDYAPSLPLIPCRPTEIEQVLLNLLRNAAQALSQKNAEGFMPEIRLRTYKAGHSIVIEIADNGPGMDESTRRRVFEPFYTTKDVGEGTGLGLSVSYFIVTNNHGGEIRVESRPGQGATFIIKLPVGMPGEKSAAE